MDHEDFLVTLNSNLMSYDINVDDLKNEKFSLAVASGQVKFLFVVESLREVLTINDVSIRKKGIEFLSWLLLKLPKELFNSSEISVLLDFYCDCLKGNHNLIPPVIRGLLELIKMKHITKENLVKVLVNLFEQVNWRTQLQTDRVIIYTILKFVVENCLEDVKSMGLNFVAGIISIIDCEADPLCLNIIFEFLPVFIKNFDLGHFNEEMFEVLSHYFPIDFEGSSKNITITREDLSEGLHQCLSATNSFSEQSIPLILEKAESTFINAKLDSYRLLKLCCKTLEVQTFEKHLSSLWKVLSKDVLFDYDEQVCSAGLSALTEVFHLLSQDESHQNILYTLLDDIFITIRSLASRAEGNMFQPAIKVLIAAASQSKPAAKRVLCHLKTFSLVENSGTLLEKKIVLSSLLPFLRICNEHKIVENHTDEEKASYLELVNLYKNSMISVDYELRKMGFLGVLDIPLNCSEDFQKALYEIISENIRTRGDVRTSDEFLQVWRKLAQNQPREFQNFISESFLDKDTKNYVPNYLWALSHIGDIPKFTNYVVSTLMSEIEDKRNYVMALECLLNVCNIANSKESSSFFQVIHSELNLIERLILWCLQLKPEEELDDKKPLFILSEIIARITRYQDAKAQQMIVDGITEMLLKKSPQLNVSGNFTLSDKNLLSFPHDLQSILIIEAVLGSIRQEVTVPMILTFREKLTNLALNSSLDPIRLSCSRLLASFVNKAEEIIALDLLNAIFKDIFAQLEKDCELELKLNSAFLFSWIIKGVILRGGPLSEDSIPTWFSLLGREDVGKAIAEGFRTVIEESNLYLNLECHCNYRVLYRQELFAKYSQLIEMSETSKSIVKMNYLLALVRLLQGVPIHLIQMKISNLIRTFIECLDSNKHDVLLIVLEILAAVLETKEEQLSAFAESFITRFLELAKFEGNMKIRINALKCLYLYGCYSTYEVFRLRNLVIRELEVCLDDNKRLVRKEATRARGRWFLIEPQREDEYK